MTRLVRCHGCGGYLPVVKDGDRPACGRCAEIVTADYDRNGRMIRGYDERGRVNYLARASSSLDQCGDEPRRAIPDPLAVLDHINVHVSPFE